MRRKDDARSRKKRSRRSSKRENKPSKTAAGSASTRRRRTRQAPAESIVQVVGPAIAKKMSVGTAASEHRILCASCSENDPYEFSKTQVKYFVGGWQVRCKACTLVPSSTAADCVRTAASRRSKGQRISCAKCSKTSSFSMMECREWCWGRQAMCKACVALEQDAPPAAAAGSELEELEELPEYRWGAPYYLARKNESAEEREAKLAAQKKEREAVAAKKKEREVAAVRKAKRKRKKAKKAKKRQKEAAEEASFAEEAEKKAAQRKREAEKAKKKREEAKEKREAEKAAQRKHWEVETPLRLKKKQAAEREAEEAARKLREAEDARIMKKQAEMEKAEERQLAKALAYSRYEYQKEIERQQAEKLAKRPAAVEEDAKKSVRNAEEEGEGEVVPKAHAPRGEMPSPRRQEEVLDNLHSIGEDAVSTGVVRDARDVPQFSLSHAPSLSKSGPELVPSREDEKKSRQQDAHAAMLEMLRSIGVDHPFTARIARAFGDQLHAIFPKVEDGGDADGDVEAPAATEEEGEVDQDEVVKPVLKLEISSASFLYSVPTRAESVASVASAATSSASDLKDTKVLLDENIWPWLQSHKGAVPQSLDTDNFRRNDDLYRELMGGIKRLLSLQKSAQGKVPSELGYPKVDLSVQNVIYLSSLIRVHQVVYWYNKSNDSVGSKESRSRAPVASRGSDESEEQELASRRELACAETARRLMIMLIKEFGLACDNELILVGSARDGTDLLDVGQQSDIDFNVIGPKWKVIGDRAPPWLEPQWSHYYEKFIETKKGYFGFSFLIGFAGYLCEQLCCIYRCEVKDVRDISYLITIAQDHWFFVLQHPYDAFCQIEASEWYQQQIACSLARSCIVTLIDEKTNGLLKSFSYAIRMWLQDELCPPRKDAPPKTTGAPAPTGRLSNSVTCTLVFSAMCLLQEEGNDATDPRNVMWTFFTRWEECATRKITSKDFDTMTGSEGVLKELRGVAEGLEHPAQRRKGILWVQELILPKASIAKASVDEFSAAARKGVKLLTESKHSMKQLKCWMKMFDARKQGRLLSIHHKQDLEKVFKTK